MLGNGAVRRRFDPGCFEHARFRGFARIRWDDILSVLALPGSGRSVSLPDREIEQIASERGRRCRRRKGAGFLAEPALLGFPQPSLDRRRIDPSVVRYIHRLLRMRLTAVVLNAAIRANLPPQIDQPLATRARLAQLRVAMRTDLEVILDEMIA